jgi:hypothetical protein
MSITLSIFVLHRLIRNHMAGSGSLGSRPRSFRHPEAAGLYSICWSNPFEGRVAKSNLLQVHEGTGSLRKEHGKAARLFMQVYYTLWQEFVNKQILTDGHGHESWFNRKPVRPCADFAMAYFRSILCFCALLFCYFEV